MELVTRLEIQRNEVEEDREEKEEMRRDEMRREEKRRIKEKVDKGEVVDLGSIGSPSMIVIDYEAFRQPIVKGARQHE